MTNSRDRSVSSECPPEWRLSPRRPKPPGKPGVPPWTIKTCTGTGGSLTREVPVCVAGEPVKAVMVCCKLAAPLTISGISINDSNYSLSKYLQHRAKWRSLSPGQQLPQTLSATRLGPGNQANCRTSDKVACCKLPIEIVNDKRRYSQHREAARLFDFKCTSGLAIPLWSTTIQSIRTRKKRLRIIAVSRVGPLSRRPALRPDKKAPAASGFWVYFELRLERHPPSTSDPLCVGRPIAF